jgi:hypothetical protein
MANYLLTSLGYKLGPKVIVYRKNDNFEICVRKGIKLILMLTIFNERLPTGDLNFFNNNYFLIKKTFVAFLMEPVFYCFSIHKYKFVESGLVWAEDFVNKRVKKTAIDPRNSLSKYFAFHILPSNSPEIRTALTQHVLCISPIGWVNPACQMKDFLYSATLRKIRGSHSVSNFTEIIFLKFWDINFKNWLKIKVL